MLTTNDVARLELPPGNVIDLIPVKPLSESETQNEEPRARAPRYLKLPQTQLF